MMEERLINMIRDVCATDTEITRETNLTFDLGLKSIDLLELVNDVEDEFGIEVTDEAVEQIHTVGELLDYIESQV
ncbi:MAG: acyl carrier protein [Oscillospiraceae bacterium]|nr:acyl carrier protein [Oscillospiraceae bacterium]MBQ4239856.1 acyl carrier protein [Oscillospiraceae bacterium]MBQ5412690.1 acyl carrier protein [Oscillospiraceae bacterium]